MEAAVIEWFVWIVAAWLGFNTALLAAALRLGASGRWTGRSWTRRRSGDWLLMGALFGRDHSANAVVFAMGTMFCLS